MTSRPRSLIFILAIGMAGIAATGVVGWLAFRNATYTEGLPDPGSLPFLDSASEAGLRFHMRFLPGEQGEKFKTNLYDHGCGLAVGDYDGDGHDDIYFVNQLGQNALFHNRGDGTFADVTAEAGVGLGDRVCVAATFADYDNDGRQDLFVTSTRGGNVLFKNQGNGTFKDVTASAGLHHVGHSQTAVFFDHDNDGHLDLFLANTAAWTTDTFDAATKSFVGKGDAGGGIGEILESPKESNVFYRNNGDGTFTDVTEKSGLKGRGWAGDAAVFDYDGDGRLDLLVTSMFGRCQLYHNNGNGTFSDVTLSVLGRTPWGGLGARAFDSNNDGKLDLYIVDMHSDMWMGTDYKHTSEKLARKHEKKKFRGYNGPNAERDAAILESERLSGQRVGFRHEELVFGNAFYRNEGQGKFTEVSEQAGLETFWPWGIAAGDFDNDGFEDVFLPAGMGYPYYYWPNALLMNQGNGTFRDRAAPMGMEPPRGSIFLPGAIGGTPAARSSRSAAIGDFDGDGRLEIVTNNFNDQPYYFKNQSPRKNYVAFRLRGTRSNRDAIGAVVRVHQGSKVLTRQVQAAGGYLTQSSKMLHIGLGDRVVIDRVEITWPRGAVQELSGMSVNTLHDIVEPE